MDEQLDGDLAAVGRIAAVQKILEVVCHATGMGFSAVARVTESRWIACAVRDHIGFGLKPGGELDVASTICDAIRRSGEAVFIDHVAKDEAYCEHGTPGKYGFQSYASVPIRLPDGSFFGTLCAIDPHPARVKNPATMGMFTLFADLIGLHLDTQARMAASEAALLDARETAKLREQFIAVLGHDLRNPLGVIDSSVEVLRMLPQDEEGRELLAIVQRSTARMAGLINDVMDFAKGRLGGGLALVKRVDGNLGAVLGHVVDELAVASGRRIVREIRIERAFACDAVRLGQLLSNLLGNAIAHGDVDGEIGVRAVSDGGGFVMSVTNRGKTLAPEVMEQLFEPFSRGAVKPGQQGLGLGLYIASEIAKAHGGKLTVESAGGVTRFEFRMEGGEGKS